jgi:1,4-dihydroxy-2-naphthoyl-CoA synthase
MLGASLVATGLADSQGLAVATDDHQEGLAAFLDKRTPRFTGR